MLCVPVVSAEVEKAATPPLRACDPNFVVPSIKFTVPVGVPVVEDFTVAVNLTVFPEVDGFSEDTTVVEVFALVTCCLKDGEVLPLKFESPE